MTDPRSGGPAAIAVALQVARREIEAEIRAYRRDTRIEADQSLRDAEEHERLLNAADAGLAALVAENGRLRENNVALRAVTIPRAERIVELQGQVTMLREALDRAHACATVRADGTCDGCFVSEVLAATEPQQEKKP